ncbi:MAG: 50S ribosomal protein L25/general stress protein Ctc [Deltaproteobacteria bacterium]|nr:50S ribosomal protein L25/general stress protein Ctc [Deltaproteobacteria bacterium]
MEQRELTVKVRNNTGKGVARKLRGEGLIPAIFYGHKSEPIALSLNPTELKKIINSESGRNTLITLKFEGKKEKERVALLKDLQLTPLKRTYLHADLYEVLMDEKITARVPIHFVGKAIGVKEGGIEQHSRREIDVRCLPGNLPDFIEADVTNLAIGDSIHVKDLKLSEGIEVLDPAGDTIVAILAPAAEKVVTPEEAAAQLAASLAEPKKEEKKEEKPTKK